MTKIPFQDLGRLHDSIRAELDRAFDSIVRTSRFVGGDPVRTFEAEFAAAHDQPTGVGCASGTDALALTLGALGVSEGDEVVVPSMTFVATAEAVRHVGAIPVLADVDPDSLLLTRSAVAAVATSRTRAVVPVHLYGNVVPFEDMCAWRDAGLLVIEDAAQAHLATWKGQSVGTVGHAACFSFYPGKNLGALGDGGMVLCDEALGEEIRSRRDHGRSSKYVHDQIGWCSRLDGLQAAFLSVKLKHLEGWTQSRRDLAEAYRKRLNSAVSVPFRAGSVHHLFVVRVDGARRQAVQQGLFDAGIQTGIHYPVPLSKQPALAAWARPTPNAEQAAEEVLSLPFDPLMSDSQVAFVCDTIEALNLY